MQLIRKNTSAKKKDVIDKNKKSLEKKKTKINDYLGRGSLIIDGHLHPLKTVSREIIGNVYEDLPSKDLLVAANMNVKYVIL